MNEPTMETLARRLDRVRREMEGHSPASEGVLIFRTACLSLSTSLLA